VIPGFMPPTDAASSITGVNLVVDRGVIW